MPGLAEQSTGKAARRDVGRFLAHHERCGSGFEIARNGKGRLHVVCAGCGEHSRYGELDTDKLRAHGVELVELTAGKRFRNRPRNLQRWLPAPPALPWWVPNAYIAGVILLGVALVAFGVLGPQQQEQGDPEGPAPSDRSPGQTAPVEPPAPQPTRPSSAAGAVGTAPPRRTPQPPPPRKVDLRRIAVLDRFAIGVPEGWGGGISDGAVAFRSPSGKARVRVFLEPGEADPQRLHEDAAAFLVREHRGAQVRRQTPGRLGTHPAVRLVASRKGGEQWAALLSMRGYTYFVIAEADAGAAASVRAASVAALRSFRPR